MRLATVFAFACALTPLAACSGGGGAAAPGPRPQPSSSAATPTPGATATPSPTPVPGLGSIKYVVIIFQENRTPDNLFQGVPGADIASSGLNTSGQTIALQPIPLANTYDLDHSHTGFLHMYDNGKMDGANTVGVSCGTSCPYVNPQYGYVPSTDNAPYVRMATQYTFGDRMFQTNQGPSYPAHQFIFAGTSAPNAGSGLLVSENTATGKQPGCLASEQAPVTVIDPAGSESMQVTSCFEHATLSDLLDAKGLSWRYYTPTSLGIWVAPNSIAHIQSGADWANVVSPETTILSDVANGTLPRVSWVIPTAAESDHAKSNDGTGPSWVASVVNAIGQSSYWNNTAIFVIWDDWGGWYDHVKPQIFGSYELGFRVPLIVISPYAKAGYVSHVQHEFGSVLKFTEEVYNIGSLGYTDARADDLSDCFNFLQTPRSFTTIASRYSASYFKHRPPDTRSPDTDY
ncbi:MAG TPA: alkaline phosphatase family protein [Candidatus Baltobacteraceae bacterium]|nr:alkaline phosphatase family protein [Candidatus Baltobacteraceae bacterium]